MFDVIGIGRSCVDYMFLLAEYPLENTKVKGSQYLVEGGGQSSTAMVALARLGLKTSFVGVVGDDEPGHFSLESLVREGVDISLVRILPEVRTPTAQIWINQATGSRTIAYLDSLADYLANLEYSADKLLAARCIMVDPFGVPLALKVANAARKKGIKLIYDLEKPDKYFEPILETATHLVASEELLSFFDNVSPRQALARIMDKENIEMAVITMGERGSMGMDREGYCYQSAFRVEVVDTTAAGDAYHAGFTYGLLKKWSLAGCMRFAAALGALVCRDLGGRASLPSLSDIQALLDSEGTDELV